MKTKTTVKIAPIHFYTTQKQRSKHYYCRFGLMGKLSLSRFIKTIFLLFLSDVVDEFTANKTLSLFYLAEPALEVCKYLEINVYNNVFDAIIIWIQIDR